MPAAPIVNAAPATSEHPDRAPVGRTRRANESALLEIRDLTVSVGQASIVQGVSLHLDRGERLALVGESGSGKTVTALSILRLFDAADATTQGEIRFEDEDVLTMSMPQVRRLRGGRVGMIFQEPMTALNPLKTIGAQIAEVLVRHLGLGGEALRRRVRELLDQVRLPQPERVMRAMPHQLSGGQRQRAMIAMAIACNPSLVIADEPTTALDAGLRKTIMDLLVELQQRLGMSLLLITHDLPVVRRYADRVMVMRDGRIVEAGPTDAIFTRPKDNYTQTLLEARQVAPMIGPTEEQAVERLRCEGVGVIVGKRRWFGTDTRSEILKGIDLSLKAGQTLGVVGESGSGKTTLALSLLQLMDGADGAVWLAGRRVDGLSERQFRPFRRDLQVVFQDPYGALSPRMNIAQIVGEGLDVHEAGLTRGERHRRIERVLEEVGLDPAVMSRYPHEFSGGQRQRIAIARALILKPKVLILDEPTSALDAAVQLQVLRLLRDLQAEHDLTYLLITHDLAVVRALAHRVIVMLDGEVIESGPTGELLDAPGHEYTRQLIDSALMA
ncbi:dipeptide ABC transporter ATP-binding protein [Guyparkeria halophila]|uniref:ABC-type dipeptide transporter n=1 Tax=Guyparkeria halophila TaxID=47960 RepID=A0ABZ0YVN5_9GAMM|nr:dipeptide ABC transporter ATP-binding protein [Guyparkeria halophila]WQH15277.1 dipeptide ABC transporter ATP-binding protein [Guyparkeria halophila]